MSNPGVVSYPESQDEERLMYKAYNTAMAKAPTK